MNRCLLAILLSFLFLAGCNRKGAGQSIDLEKHAATKNISSRKARKLIKKNRENPDFVIIDVRTESEFKQGHIENSLNIDFFSSDFNIIIEELKRKNTYLVYCAAGVRSLIVMKIMEDKGFPRVYNLERGLNRWKAKGFHLED